MISVAHNAWARTKAGLNHPPAVLSTRAVISVRGKKNPLAFWQPPCALFQVPHSIPKCDIIQLPVPLNNYTPLAQYTPKRPQNQGNSAQATNYYFSVLCDFPCRGAQCCISKYDPHGCAQNSSPGPVCALLADSWLQCPTSQPGSLVWFHPCLLPVTASALSSTLITYNPIFWISLELLDMLSPCSVLWLSWCTQAPASDSWSRSFTSYCYLLPPFSCKHGVAVILRQSPKHSYSSKCIDCSKI